MTDTDARLIERLRVIRGIQFTPIENELVAEAADRIESLAAEVARLREALLPIADIWSLPSLDKPHGRQWHCHHEEWLSSASILAAAALGDSK